MPAATPLDRFFEAFDADDHSGALAAVRDGVKGAQMGPRGLSVLSCALMSSSIEVVEGLIASDDSIRSATPDANGLLPVDYAFAGTRFLNLNAALLAGANPNQLNGHGRPALQQAIVDISDSLYQLRDEDALYQNLAALMLRGADPATPNAKGQDFEAFARELRRPYLSDFIKEVENERLRAPEEGQKILALMEASARGASTAAAPSEDFQRARLNEALLAACKSGEADAIRGRAQSGASVEASDPKEGSALIMAIKSGSLAAVETLLELGARADAPFSGARGAMLPIHVASAMGSAAMCEALVRAGADVDARLNNDLTPAMLAIASERWENLASLIRLGADGSLANSDGKDLAGLAREGAHEDIAQWIPLALEARNGAPAAAAPALPARSRGPR